MKNSIQAVTVLILTVIFFTACKKADDPSGKILSFQVNKEYVLIRDVQTLRASDDEISLHVDSILSGLITAGYVSSGIRLLSLYSAESADIGFEIIDLEAFNPAGLPDSFDHLAARVIPGNIEVLDNSTYGYPDALSDQSLISAKGNWTSSTCVLGTFQNAGQFNGKGERYLGIRKLVDDHYRYGWVKLYCSQHNDTLRIIEFAYMESENTGIMAGQKD